MRNVRKQRLSGIIYETEAYLGTKDPSCHTYQNKKSMRNQVMYERGGIAYVYFTYGMHYCFNIVTSKKNTPEAVLVRAIFPTEGIKRMALNRNFPKKEKDISNGPAKLCKALKIDKTLNGIPLNTSALFIEDKQDKTGKIITTKRVGLNPSSKSFRWPLRFYLKDYESLIMI